MSYFCFYAAYLLLAILLSHHGRTKTAVLFTAPALCSAAFSGRKSAAVARRVQIQV